MKSGISANETVFAVFVTGLQKVPNPVPEVFCGTVADDCAKLPVEVRTTAGSLDYKLDQIPSGAIGQVYVLLSMSDEDFSDPNIVAGPAILEVYPRGQIPSTPRAACS